MARQPILMVQVKKLLVDERKKMRVAQKESRFKQRTLAIYKGQIARAAELNKPINYTLEEFREFVKPWLTQTCVYCDGKVTVNNFVCDHKTPVSREGEFTLKNLAVVDKSCNWQKGTMNLDEFLKFNAFINEYPSEVSRDIRMRLSSGGRWTPKG